MRPLLTLVIPLVVAACSGLRTNEREKPASFAPWRDASVGEEPATQYLLKRSALLLIGVDGMADEQGHPNPVSVPTLHGKEQAPLRGGAAAAIDERGYWLTAAHCVELQPMVLVTSDGSSMRWWPVRIVWNGRDNAEGTGVDLALLHAAGEPFSVMPYGTPPPLAGRILCRGSGLGSDIFCAGTIIEVEAARGATGCITIHHDAPIAQGDSGGPAMCADGALAGINVTAMRSFFGLGAPRATALYPDPEFIRRLIEADIAQHPFPHSSSAK